MSDDNQQREPFYTETGKISDIGNAQDLARTEANLGRNAALIQEKRMATEHENGGLTEEEVFNEERCTYLLEKYPEAFVGCVNEEGKREVKLSSYCDTAGEEVGRRIKGAEESCVRTTYFNPIDLQPVRNLLSQRETLFSRFGTMAKEIFLPTIAKSQYQDVLWKMMMQPDAITFSRRGIEVVYPIAKRIFSLKNLDENELSLFEKICEYRNDQQKLNKTEFKAEV